MRAVKLIHTTEITTDEWKERRKIGIGSSDASVVAGLNPWKSPFVLWLEKTNRIDGQEPNERMEIGTEIEDWIARKFAKQYKKDTGEEIKVQNCNYILQHPEHLFVLANIDRELICKQRGRGVLECKNTSEYMKGEWDEDKIPDMYYLQVQHQLAVTGYQWGYIAVLIGGNKFRYKYFERDEEVIQSLIKLESDFWELVEKDLMPDIDGSESTTEHLLKLYPEHKQNKVVQLKAEDKMLLMALEQAKKDIKEAEARASELENKLKAKMGDAEIALTIDNKPLITWKATISNRIDSTKLKAERPEIYKAYIKQSSARRFLVKNGG